MNTQKMIGKQFAWESKSGNKYDGTIHAAKDTNNGVLLTVYIGHDDFGRPQYRSTYVDPKDAVVRNFEEGEYLMVG